MSAHSDRLKLLSSILTGIVFVTGVVVMVGWLGDMPQLTKFFPESASMKFNSAIGVLLGSLAVAFLRGERNPARRVLRIIVAAVIVGLGMLTLAEYVFHVDLGVDEWLVKGGAVEPGNPFPSRMSPVSAACFVLIGMAILAIDYRKDRRVFPAELLTLAALLLSLLGLIGYLYSARALYRIGPYSSMAIPTAICMILLALAILAARPDRGMMALLGRNTAGSVLARRLLPVALLMPLILGYVRIKGEQAGLYELPFGTAWFATTLMVVFIVLIWWTAVSLDRGDMARKEAETKLRDLALFPAQNPAPVLRISRTGELLFANLAATRSFGDLPVGQPAPPFLRELAAQAFVTGNIFEREIRMRERDFLFTVTSILEYGYANLYGRDITERKKAVEGLREAEHLFRSLVLSSSQAVWRYQPTAPIGHQLDPGSAGWWRELTGQTEEQRNANDGTGWLMAIWPNDRDRIQHYWSDLVKVDAPQTAEYRVRRRDGEWRWMRLRGVPIKDANGTITEWAGTVNDVTDRKKVEEELALAQVQLQQHAKDLEHTVTERTTRLREAVQELEAFSYSIAHDMRAPLRAMQGFAKILSEDHGAKLDPDARGYLDRIRTAAERLDRLIQDVLNYSQIVRGDVPLEAVDARQLLEDIVGSYPNLQPAKLQLITDGRLPVVLANPAALTQVFSNLLANAVKFVKPGVFPQIKVSACRATPENGAARVRFWFEDNGIGIEPVAQKRIFEMFQRLNRPGMYEGTGMGLAIVRKAVERMGGKVGVESEPGAGSRFWVELRQADEPA